MPTVYWIGEGCEKAGNVHAVPDSTPLHHQRRANVSRTDQIRPIFLAHKVKQRGHPKDERTKSKVSRPRSSDINSLALAQSARTNLSLLSSLGAGHIDPFNVCLPKDLPIHIHRRLNHVLHSGCKAYVSSEQTTDLELVRSQLVANMHAPLACYSVMMASILYYAFDTGHSELPHRDQLLCLSYQTKIISLIQDDIRANGGSPSEAGLLGIATLIVHGGWADRRFIHDKVQERKAFGTANDMHYYSGFELDRSHWKMLSQFVQNRGGPSALKLKILSVVLLYVDVLKAWRTLSRPVMQPLMPTATAVTFARDQPDEVAHAQLRKVLSGLPVGFRTCPESPYALLYAALQHTRTLMIRFDQWQRREREWRPDLRQIHLTRLLVLRDLLDLKHLEPEGNGLNMTYEMCRLSSLAFMQLVLVPVAMNNDMPKQLLNMILPLVRQARNWIKEGKRVRTDEGTLKADPCSPSIGVFLWTWMLAGMLALEHLQTKGESEWMDKLAPNIEDMPVKVEKGMWATVKGAMETCLWLSSECDAPGQQWWNYVCLWTQERRREEISAQLTRSKWTLDADSSEREQTAFQ